MDITLEQLTHDNYDEALTIDRTDIPNEWVDDVPALMGFTDYGAEHELIGHTFLARLDGRVMKYDAATIGNHEFDFGLDNMAKLFRMAEFPIICSNYDFTGTPCEGLVKPYIVLKRDGVKIGVFALAPAMKGLVFDGNCKGVAFLDPAETAQKYIDILRKQEKCDIVICVSHLGWKSEYSDEDFVKLTEGCDLVLGGHTHTYMPVLEYAPDKNGKKIPVDQNGKHGVFIGKMVLELEK